MAIDSMNVNSGGGADFDKPANKVQEEQLKKFESIFNRLDENGDGAIDDKDDLSGKDRVMANHLQQMFDNLQNILGKCYELTLEGIRNLINDVEKKYGHMEADEVKQQFIMDTINEDEMLVEPRTEQGEYNGVQATLSYDVYNRLVAIKTSATNPTDAAKLMGLNGSYESDEGIIYTRTTENDNVVTREDFQWNEQTQSMVPLATVIKHKNW
jgi:hypothetical protein